MDNILFTIIIAIVAGLIDILPMLKMKLDQYSIASTFIFYVVLSFVIVNIDLFGLNWWIKGGVTGAALAIPMMIMVMKDDRKAGLLMFAMAMILSTLISAVHHFYR